ASARETAGRVAVGGLTDNFLKYFNVEIISHVIQIGNIFCGFDKEEMQPDFDDIRERVVDSALGCYDRSKEGELKEYIDTVKRNGDSLGGIIEVRTNSLPVGLGSHTQWDRKLDGRLARAVMSIPAVKGVEIGPAFTNSTCTGAEVHDEIFFSEEKGYYRQTNRAGGLEGGMTNGEPLVIRLAMKPIPTLYKPLKSVDIESKETFEASVERSDVTAVQAAGVVGEAMVSFVLAGAMLDKFGGDSIEETRNNYKRYITSLKE
ncbi:MAG: chorismate synthase, partial [Halanaerobiales bacterium]